jgi:hypothetical protein
MNLQIFSDLHVGVGPVKSITIGKHVHAVAVAGDLCEGARNSFIALRADMAPAFVDANCQRRKPIEAMDILEPVPGIPGRARLLVGLDCRSPAMAGKILSGAHTGNRVWQAGLHVGAPS